MMMPFLVNILWLVPVAAWLFTKRMTSPLKGIIRGASFGAIVSPASMGLYALYFVAPIAAIFGLLGLGLSLFHGSVGYEIAIAAHVVPSNTVVSSRQSFYIEAINGVFWAVVYGLIGFAISTISKRGKKLP